MVREIRLIEGNFICKKCYEIKVRPRGHSMLNRVNMKRTF